MDRVKQVNRLLYDKMAEEQKEFVDELKGSSSEYVIEKAYELVMREDILLSIEGEDLSISQANALLKLKFPLDAIYQEWLDNDFSHMDMVRDTITDCADFHVKQQKTKNQRCAGR